MRRIDEGSVSAAVPTHLTQRQQRHPPAQKPNSYTTGFLVPVGPGSGAHLHTFYYVTSEL